MKFPAWLLWIPALGLIAYGLWPGRETVARSEGMSTLPKPKKPAAKTKSTATTKKPFAGKPWIGSVKGRIKPGVDLTKPT